MNDRQRLSLVEDLERCRAQHESVTRQLDAKYRQVSELLAENRQLREALKSLPAPWRMVISGRGEVKMCRYCDHGWDHAEDCVWPQIEALNKADIK